jgi:hypothetical protein
MRKFYSLVLMATALLIGTNLQAVNVTDYAGIQAAIAAAVPGTPTTIVLDNDISDVLQIYAVSGKNIVIDFNGHNITQVASSTYSMVYVEDGSLELKNTKNEGGVFSGTQASYVYGTNDNVANYSVLTIGKGVTLTTTNGYGVILYNASAAPMNGYGIVFDLYGEVRVESGVALWVMGNIQAKTGNIPQVNIHAGATIVSSSAKVCLYGGGYAQFNIEGTVEGGTGIYAKAGDYNITGNAVVRSTASTHEEVEANGDGYTGGIGCAIVADSKKGYAGDMEIAISGNATLESNAEGGYAIEEVKSDEDKSKTESIVIESGTINGNLKTTAEVKENITINGTITGGTFTQDITEYLSNVTGVITPVPDENGKTVYVINEKPTTAGDWKTTIVGAAATDYVRMENGSPVTLSADAQAEYLVMQGTAKIIVPEGLKLTVKEIVMGKDAVIEVAAGGKLIVTGAQGIVSNHASNLVLHTSESAQAIFLLNPAVISNKHPHATVEFVTKSFMKDGVNVFQRFGIPTYTALESMECSDPSIRTRVWEYSAATDSWQEFGNLGSFDIHQLNVPFAGYNMISYRETPGLVYTMKGALVGNENASLDANLHWTTFANSFSADIDIAKFVAGISGTVDPTVYLYKVNNVLTQEYTWEPVNATILSDFHDSSLEKIAPMRAFILNNKGTSAQLNTVDYASMVYAPAMGAAGAPRRRVATSNNTAKLSVMVANEQGAWDKLYLIENDDFSAEYESGRDAEKYMNDDINVYAQVDEKQAILATNDLNDTYVGFSTVKGGKFTISFANVEGRELTLIDHETGARVAMVEGATYEFTAGENTINDYRFEIVGRQNMPTAIDNTEAVKSAKGIYTITGQYVGEMNVWNTLPAGVYVVNGEKRVK